MHFYQFHIGDYKSHTHHLSHIEDLAFRRLLDYYYLHEVPIKQRDIARQIGMRDYEQEVLSILDEFFESTEKGYINQGQTKKLLNIGSLLKMVKRVQAFDGQRVWIAPLMGRPLAPLMPPQWQPITKNQ